jgi:hypothetical protein
MNDKLFKHLNFPRSVKISIEDSEVDFFNDVRCRTYNMLKEQMSTFGLTICRVHKLEHQNHPEKLIQFIDKKEKKIVLEVRVSDECECIITYKYEDYEGEI